MSRKLHFEEIDVTTQNGPDAQATFVLRSQREFDELIALYGLKLEYEDVDFSQSMILAVFMGRKSSGGYSVDIDSVEEDEVGITAKVITSDPGMGGGSTAFTHPIAFGVVSRSSKHVAFDWEKLE